MATGRATPGSGPASRADPGERGHMRLPPKFEIAIRRVHPHALPMQMGGQPIAGLLFFE
ncbi:hypothetical protein [Limimaricola sp. AA108-03]|uniref:hypothetical protein n=1 Tax=Limimaricola sp. AA108-03 TaxID=3425945 RepID=UPI003D786333